MRKPSMPSFGAALFGIACQRSDTPSETPRGDTISAVAVVAASSTSVNTYEKASQPLPSLTCSPKVLGPNDTLTLEMKTPHGDYLTANQPDGSLFYIVYPKLGDPSRKYSLVPSETFKSVPVLRLPSNFRAIPWKYGRDTTERFFNRPGRYLFWVGENLEGDLNPRAVSCEVVFRP